MKVTTGAVFTISPEVYGEPRLAVKTNTDHGEVSIEDGEGKAGLSRLQVPALNT